MPNSAAAANSTVGTKLTIVLAILDLFIVHTEGTVYVHV
jgi:hypothetical protein